jgi:N-acetyl-anhydromuramyl-L-alanine amidase AmpD
VPNIPFYAIPNNSHGDSTNRFARTAYHIGKAIRGGTQKIPKISVGVFPQFLIFR